jgi:hypothetical protein
LRLERGEYQLRVAAALGLFVLATNAWSDASSWGGDVVNYERMAHAAPGLPGGSAIGSAFTERFGFHWLVGAFADATGTGVRTSYHLAALVCALLVVLVAAAIFRALDVRRWVYVVGLAAFVLAAYSDIRDVLQAPGAVTDLTFVLGAAVMLLGLVRVNPGLVIAGVLVGLVARQTMLLAVLATAAWVLLDPAWRAQPTRRRAGTAAGALLAAAVAYVAIRAAVDPFTTPGAPDSPADTIVVHSGTPRELGAHLLRCAIAVTVVAVPLLAALALLRARAIAIPRRVWLSLLLFASIFIQPVVISPGFVGFASNEQRLAGLALLPLCAALAIALEAAARRGAVPDPSPRVLALVVGLLALGSLHHVSTWVGPASLAQFLVLQLVAALGVAAAVTRLAARSSYGGAARQ